MANYNTYEVTEYRVEAHSAEGFEQAGVYDTMAKAQGYITWAKEQGYTTKLFIETYLDTDEPDWAQLKREEIAWDCRYDDIEMPDED